MRRPMRSSHQQQQLTFLQTLRALGEGPWARRVLAFGRSTPPVCPDTLCPYPKGCSHHSSTKPAKRRRASLGLDWAWAGRGTPPGIPGERPARRLPSFWKCAKRPNQANYPLAEPRRVHGRRNDRRS
jgi:hypothetical protein